MLILISKSNLIFNRFLAYFNSSLDIDVAAGVSNTVEVLLLRMFLDGCFSYCIIANVRSAQLRAD